MRRCCRHAFQDQVEGRQSLVARRIRSRSSSRVVGHRDVLRKVGGVLSGGPDGLVPEVSFEEIHSVLEVENVFPAGVPR